MLKLSVPQDTETLLGAGVYEWKGSAAHAPSSYIVPPYELIATYGKGEAEEVAARIITVCQEHGSWAILDYNVLWRMFVLELSSGKLQNYEVNSHITMEMYRMMATPESAFRAVIDVGLNYLAERGFIVLHDMDEKNYIELTSEFFEPIKRFAPTPA